MNAQMSAGNACGNHFAHDTGNIMGQHAAIGVAQHDPASARIISSANGLNRIGGIGFVAVEEMFGIEHHLGHAGAGMGNGFGDHAEVFLQLDPQRHNHLEIPAFAHHGHRINRCRQNGIQPRIIIRRAACPARHAECRQLGRLEHGRCAEKSIVGRIGSRPSAFHIIQPQRIQFAGNLDLIGGRKIHALRLRAIAQGRIVYVDALVHYGVQIMQATKR